MWRAEWSVSLSCSTIRVPFTMSAIDIGEQLVEILCAKCKISLAQHNQRCIFSGQCLLETTINASAVPRLRFSNNLSAGAARNFERAITAIVIHYDDAAYARIPQEIFDRTTYALFVIVCSKRHYHAAIGHRSQPVRSSTQSFAGQQEEKITNAQQQSNRCRESAEPDDRLHSTPGQAGQGGRRGGPPRKRSPKSRLPALNK